MADNFASQSKTCCECGDQFGDFVSYTVTERQLLCGGCAVRKTCAIVPDANQAVWRCPEHEKELVKVVDTTCGYRGMCHTCALTDHAGHTFEDVEKLEETLRKKVRERRSRVQEKEEKLKSGRQDLEEGERTFSEYITFLQDQISEEIDEELAIVKGEQREKDDVIRQRAKEEIRRIKEQMELDIAENRGETERLISELESKRNERHMMVNVTHKKSRFRVKADEFREALMMISKENTMLETLIDANVEFIVSKVEDVMVLKEKTLPCVPDIPWVPKETSFHISKK